MRTAQEAAELVRTANTERKEAAAIILGERPPLTVEGAVEYLDWLLTAMHVMAPHEVKTHLQAAELAIRVHMGNAQDKATAHTLQEDAL